jgi:seryl-tRNA(Sec) selenium transferase
VSRDFSRPDATIPVPAQREEIIARCLKHPLMRALRTGKESYAVIAARHHRKPLCPRRRHDAGREHALHRRGHRRKRARFLQNGSPIVGRIVDDRFILDMRTLLDEDLPPVSRVIATP